jgi:hypothetical protein
MISRSTRTNLTSIDDDDETPSVQVREKGKLASWYVKLSLLLSLALLPAMI